MSSPTTTHSVRIRPRRWLAVVLAPALLAATLAGATVSGLLSASAAELEPVDLEFFEDVSPDGITDDGTVIGTRFITGTGNVPVRWPTVGEPTRVDGLPAQGIIGQVHSDGAFRYFKSPVHYGVRADGTSGTYEDPANDRTGLHWMNREAEAVGGKFERGLRWSGFNSDPTVVTGVDTMIAINDAGNIVFATGDTTAYRDGGDRPYPRNVTPWSILDVGDDGALLLSDAIMRPGSIEELPFRATAMTADGMVVGLERRATGSGGSRNYGVLLEDGELVDLTDLLAGERDAEMNSLVRVHNVIDISDTCWIVGQAEMERYDGSGSTYRYFRFQLADCEPEPELDIELFRVDGLGKEVREGDTVDVRMRVTNESGEPITGLTLDSIGIVGQAEDGDEGTDGDDEEDGGGNTDGDGDGDGDGDDGDDPIGDEGDTPDSGAIAELDGPGGEYPELPTELGTGPASVGFVDFTLTGVDAGEFQIEATVSATDADGARISHSVTEEWLVRSQSLDVEVVASPEEIDVEQRIADQPAAGGDGEAEPVEVTITVTVTNTDEDTVDSITMPETLELLADDDSPVVGVRIRQLGGPRLPQGATGPADVGPFSLAPSEERTLEYVVEVVDDGGFEVEAQVQYEAPATGATRVAIGTGKVRAVGDRLLGIVLEPLEELPTFVVGGEPHTFAGDLYNFSATDTIEVDLSSFEIEVEGNAEVLSIRPLEADLDAETCYLAPTVELEPGERFPIHALLVTSPNGGTRGAFEITAPDAVRIDDEGVRTELEEEDFDVEPDPMVYEHRVDVSVATRGPWTAADYVEFGNGLAVGFVDGAIEWTIAGLNGTARLIEAATDWENLEAAGMWAAEHALKAAKFYVEWNFTMTRQDRLAFATDVGQQVYDLAVAAGKTLEDADAMRAAAEAIVPGWFDQVEQAYASNDPAALGEAFGRVSGNVGLEVMSCVMPTPKWKGRFKTLATEVGDDAAAEAARISRIADAGADSFGRQTSRASLRNGALIDARGATKLWGLGADAYRALIKFADENQLLVTLRDRSPGSLQRLAEGFIEKMEHMKLKNVNMDIDGPLGYLDDHADTVAFKKPIPRAQLDDELAKISDPDLRQEVLDRWTKRGKEWDKYHDLYRGWEQSGFPSGFEYKPNGAIGEKALTRLPFRLRQVTDAAGNELPDYFVPEVFADGQWRGFTGDIDIVDIRHATGRSLNADDARWVYDQLKEMPGVSLRHGDTLHWISAPGMDAVTQFKVKVGQLQDYFVGATDKLLQLGPGGARAAQLDPLKTFVADAAQPDRSTYATFAGGFQQKVSTVQIGRYMVEVVDDEINPMLFWRAPTEWVLRGGTEDEPLGDCQPVADAGSGHILRQSPAGDVLEVYQDGTWQTFDASQCGLGGPDPQPMRVQSTGTGPAAFAMSAEGAGTDAPASEGTVALPYAPQTALAVDGIGGDTLLEVHDLPEILGDDYVGDWLEVGDEIVVSPGSEIEERHTIASLDPLTTVAPLAQDHPTGSLVVLVDRPGSGSGQVPPGGGTRPPGPPAPDDGDGAGEPTDEPTDEPGDAEEPAPDDGDPDPTGHSPVTMSRTDRIARLYQAAFGRPADAGGLAHWAGTGMAVAHIAEHFASSGEFRARYGSPDHAGYVRQLYRNILGRDGDPAGIAHWVTLLATGATRGTVLVAFADSEELIRALGGDGAAPVTMSRTDRIARLYQAAFGRPADAGGLAHWAGTGMAVAHIAEHFASSGEFRARYGSPDHAGYVRQLYRNILGRDGDPAGIAHWVTLLATGATRGTVLVAFADSEELIHRLRTGAPS